MPKTTTQPEPSNATSHTDPEPVPLVSESDLLNATLRVADVMTANPRTCSPFSTVLEAVMIFRDVDCGVVPVVEDDVPIGVLTDRDVALALAEHTGDLASRRVSDLMSKGVVTASADEPLAAVFDRLGREGVRRLMVVDTAGRIQGVLTWADIAPYLSDCALGRVVSRILESR
jgi:predicted transcriptional regulator